MKKKLLFQIVSLLVTVAFMLTGCSSGQKSPTDSASPEGTNANSKPGEITIAFFTLSSQTSGIPEVEAAVSKIAEEKINTKVKFLPISFGSYVQQMNLMNASGEKLDLLVSSVFGGPSYSSMAATGQIIPLNDLLEKHGQGITEVMGPYLEYSKIDGKVFGIPRTSDLAQGFGVAMRKDLVDKHKIDISTIKTLDDMTPILKLIKEKEPGVTPMVQYQPGGASTPVQKTGIFNILQDGFGVLKYDGDGKTIVNMFETEEYAKELKRARAWFEAGYIQKDAATTKDNGNDLIKANRAFAYTTNLKPDLADQATKTTGKEMITVPVTTPVLESTTSFAWSISKNSKDPERAMMFLNLMYTNPDIVNLLSYGIEGRDYVKASPPFIRYPDGVTAETVPYGLNLGWLFGNQLISHVFEGTASDIWSQMEEFNRTSVKSAALGFVYDNAAVKNETAAVTAVDKEFRLGLETGTLDPDKTLPELNKKLKDAGIERIIAEKQKQFDAWLQSK